MLTKPEDWYIEEGTIFEKMIFLVLCIEVSFEIQRTFANTGNGILWGEQPHGIGKFTVFKFT